MKGLFPNDYNFIPQTYLFPEDYKRFITEREIYPNILWIMKPSCSSCGRGIKMISRKTSNINNRKFYY